MPYVGPSGIRARACPSARSHVGTDHRMEHIMTDTLSPAAVAVDALALSLTEAGTASTALLVKRYGAGTDAAAVRLALAAARVAAGGNKPRGGSGQRINDVLASVTSDSTPLGYVISARAVLDAHAAAVKTKREADSATRKALVGEYNGKRATLAGGIEAAHALAAFDYGQGADKRAAALTGFQASLTRAANVGLTVFDVLDAVALAYGMDSGAIVVAPVTVPESATV